MAGLRKQPIRLNSALTRIIIDLHEKGYSEDFLMLEHYKYLCLRNGAEFHLYDSQVEVLVKVFDQLSGDYKYIHKIDTDSGMKGLLIADSPCVVV
jgi:hypothetical protein